MAAPAARYSIEEARAELDALAARAGAGESITLVSADGRVLAVLGPPLPPRGGRVGSMRGTLTVLGDDVASTSSEWPDPA